MTYFGQQFSDAQCNLRQAKGGHKSNRLRFEAKKLIEEINMAKLLAADYRGKVFEIPELEAVGMKAGKLFNLKMPDLIKLPATSEIFRLPDRAAIAYDPIEQRYVRGENHVAVAAFLSPGYTITYNSAYREIGSPKLLPLFAYAACAVYKKDIYAAAVRVDKSLCHDSRRMDITVIKKKISALKKIYKANRLIGHLERCALCYSCPNAKNFFLNRYEAPLPTSPACNARCAGCISYQPKKRCPVTQPRITFIPTPVEIAQIALYHIDNVKDAILSFGQGCEGEPLLSSDAIEKSIKLIRAKTSKGTINMNTNGSRPKAVARLFDAGLDSIRVSLNSAREPFYSRYYKPKGYSFNDVLKSIENAKERKGYVSLNYLTMPGFTDSLDEIGALKNLVKKGNVDMIQWRNLNYDPLRYFEELKISGRAEEMFGVKEMIESLKKEFPKLKMGYFNKPTVIASDRLVRRSFSEGGRERSNLK